MDIRRAVSRDAVLALGISIVIVGALMMTAHARVTSRTRAAAMPTTRQVPVPIQQLKDDTTLVGPKK